jgi:hypothetical protein
MASLGWKGLSELVIVLSIRTMPSWSAWFTISLLAAPQQQHETAVPANTNHSSKFAHFIQRHRHTKCPLFIYHITNMHKIQNTVVYATTESSRFMRFTVLPVGALLNKQKQLMAWLRSQALTTLFLALGTAIGVEGAKSLPARIQG